MPIPIGSTDLLVYFGAFWCLITVGRRTHFRNACIPKVSSATYGDWASKKDKKTHQTTLLSRSPLLRHPGLSGTPPPSPQARPGPRCPRASAPSLHPGPAQCFPEPEPRPCLEHGPAWSTAPGLPGTPAPAWPGVQQRGKPPDAPGGGGSSRCRPRRPPRRRPSGHARAPPGTDDNGATYIYIYIL